MLTPACVVVAVDVVAVGGDASNLRDLLRAGGSSPSAPIPLRVLLLCCDVVSPVTGLVTTGAVATGIFVSVVADVVAAVAADTVAGVALEVAADTASRYKGLAPAGRRALSYCTGGRALSPIHTIPLHLCNLLSARNIYFTAAPSSARATRRRFNTWTLIESLSNSKRTCLFFF